MTKKKDTFTNEVHIITDEVDYLNFVTRSSTKKQRRKFNIGDIFINAAVCKLCGEYVRSKHRHDFVTCSCGSAAVDGGSWYVKRMGDPKNIINVIENFYK